MINWDFFRPWNLFFIVGVVLITNFLMSAAKTRLDNRISAAGGN